MLKVRYWLYINLLLVAGIVALGGITRLEGAGLSITEWKPITGIIPPFSLQDWQILFQQYQLSPEFLKITRGITMNEFQYIYWLEYFHRLLARAIGLAFMLPAMYFWLKKDLPKSMYRGVISIGLLILLQGAMGWYMVKSGLIQDPHVSHYRLAMHLLLAFIIFVYILRLTLDTHALKPVPIPRATLRLTRVVQAIVVITIIYGAFVAGMRAGLLYNTFPKMGLEWIPGEVFYLNPWWMNLWENPVTVQLIHRWLGMLTAGMTLGLVTLLPPNLKIERILLVTLVSLQVLLGILTLLNHVPTALATFHQLGALGVFSVVMMLRYRFR
jgi:heme a synthase